MHVTYSVDRLRINSMVLLEDLQQTLPVALLERGCVRFRLDYASPKARLYGFKSHIELSGPQQECVKLLLQHEHNLGEYSISRLEIARDTRHETMLEVQQELGLMVSRQFMRYDRKGPIIFHTRRKTGNKVGIGGRVPGPTLYLGNKGFRYVVYGRYSKIDGQPCIHEEFRFFGKNCKKHGIRGIQDFFGDDGDALKSHFEKLYRRYIYSVDLDFERYGKFCLGMSKAKKELSKRDAMRVSLVKASIRSIGDNKAFSWLESRTRSRYLAG